MMQKVIEGWVPEDQTVNQIFRAEITHAREGVHSSKGMCVCCHGSAKRVRITITVEELDKEMNRKES